MTPNNIVNMSIIKGLDVIAVTDHNSAGNIRAVEMAAGDNILVVPGIEVETSEEVHVVCYFPSVSAAEEMESRIRKVSTPVKNRPEIFGSQFYMNEMDEVVGEEENLLVTASGMSIYDVVENAKSLGGVAIPAHIDRESYSVLSNLGFLPPDLSVSALEITKKNREEMSKNYLDFKIISNSDAHYLENISEREFFIDIKDKTAQAIIDFFVQK